MRNLFLYLFIFTTSFSFAQKSLTYISDRKFNDPTDLLGYNFRPTMMEIKDVKKQNLVPGSYAFGITQNNLYVEGEGIAGVYSVNSINSTEFGYKMALMNARDPTLQGHLKIIVNKKHEVEALVFLRSNKDKETIFYIANIPPDFQKKEAAYFTDKGEKIFFHPDSLWGKTIRPFLIIHQEERVQERVEMKDSISVQFVEKVTIIDKTKKKNKDKEGKDTIAFKDAPPKPEAKKDIKIVKEHFVYLRAILKYQDGTVEDKETEYKIKNYSLKEDKRVDYEGDRYLILLETNKGDMNIFLNGDKAVNSIEFGHKIYYVRGM
jgi:hypothetical protein